MVTLHGQMLSCIPFWPLNVYRYYWILWLSDSVTYWILWLLCLLTMSHLGSTALYDSVTYWILWLFGLCPRVVTKSNNACSKQGNRMHLMRLICRRVAFIVSGGVGLTCTSCTACSRMPRVTIRRAMPRHRKMNCAHNFQLWRRPRHLTSRCFNGSCNLLVEILSRIRKWSTNMLSFWVHVSHIMLVFSLQCASVNGQYLERGGGVSQE